jgi:preprotein translocase subunit SecD
LREAPVGTQARIVYVHEEVIVTNEDVAQARAVPGSDATRAGVEVVFTPRGAARLHAATAAHLDRPVAVSIDGLVVMAPVVRSPIGERAIVTGDFSREEAERIVRGLTAR